MPNSSPMAKDYQRLWKAVISTTDEAKAIRTLANILADKEGRTFISRLDRTGAELCIEILDHGIAQRKLNKNELNSFFVTLRRLAGSHGRLPDSMIITEKIESSGDILASGGFSDVRSGMYMGYLVAVKTIRVAEKDNFTTIRKQFCKEVILWNTVSHPNVLKLVGVQGDMGKGQFVTVSEWMAHGNIVEFIKKNYVNRLELLHGAAQGLKYLHGAGLTHGDLKGANILMSNDTPPRACLADFGFMTVVLDPVQPLSCSAKFEGGTKMFMPPELMVPSKFNVPDSMPTTEADVYAFGLVTFQVLTGKLPFPGLRDSELVYAVVVGQRPTKPENASAIGFSDSLWGFAQRCWNGDRELRPKVAEIVAVLGEEAANWKGLMPPCIQDENVASSPEEEPESDSMRHGGIFESSLSTTPESPAESQAPSDLFSLASTPSTQCSETLQEEPQWAAAKPPMDPPREKWGPIQRRSRELPDDPRGETFPRLAQDPCAVPPQKRLKEHVVGPSIEPQEDPLGTIRRRPQVPFDDLQEEIFQHLDQNFPPPPTAIPTRERKSFRQLTKKFLRRLFSHRH